MKEIEKRCARRWSERVGKIVIKCLDVKSISEVKNFVSGEG